jgi:hypothetical protein
MRHIVTFVAVLAVLGARYPAFAFPVQISLKAGDPIVLVKKGHHGHGEREERGARHRWHHGRHHGGWQYGDFDHGGWQYQGFGGNLNQPNGQN